MEVAKDLKERAYAHWACLEKSDPLDFQEMHRMKKHASSFRLQIVNLNSYYAKN